MNYACESCGTSFTKHRNLLRHQKSIQGNKNFVCERCNESFTRKDALMRNHKKHQGTVTHNCDICGKTFHRCDKLNEHKVFCQTNCGETPRKRKREDDNCPAPKRARIDEQIGDDQQHDNQLGREDDDPCTSALTPH